MKRTPEADRLNVDEQHDCITLEAWKRREAAKRDVEFVRHHQEPA